MIWTNSSSLLLHIRGFGAVLEPNALILRSDYLPPGAISIKLTICSQCWLKICFSSKKLLRKRRDASKIVEFSLHTLSPHFFFAWITPQLRDRSKIFFLACDLPDQLTLTPITPIRSRTGPNSILAHELKNSSPPWNYHVNIFCCNR